MCAQLSDKISEEVLKALLQVMEINGIDPEGLKHMSSKEFVLDDKRGAIALIMLEDGRNCAVANMPFLTMPVLGVHLNYFELMQLIFPIAGPVPANFAMKANTLYLTLCMGLKNVGEEDAPRVIQDVKKIIEAFRVDALKAIQHFYQVPEKKYPEPTLPNIKMTPGDRKVIFGVLAGCSADEQEIYTFLMESWAKEGFLVETTSYAIVFDIPYGDGTARLALLHPGVPESTDVSPLTQMTKPSTIILLWESLYKRTGLPADAVEVYQKTVKKFTALHITESSAHIMLGGKFDLEAAKTLIKAMTQLAKSVQIDLIEKPEPTSKTTPANIESTLSTCDSHSRNIFEYLIAGWKSAEGTVQAPKPGRIYLKMKTKAHKNGNLARMKRNFNLIVLAAPKGKRGPTIQVTWGLAHGDYAYLDCIPDSVNRFETVVSVLEGFEQEGTITRMYVNDKFKKEHAEMLLKVMKGLKVAEEEAE